MQTRGRSFQLQCRCVHLGGTAVSWRTTELLFSLAFRVINGRDCTNMKHANAHRYSHVTKAVLLIIMNYHELSELKLAAQVAHITPLGRLWRESRFRLRLHSLVYNRNMPTGKFVRMRAGSEGPFPLNINNDRSFRHSAWSDLATRRRRATPRVESAGPKPRKKRGTCWVVSSCTVNPQRFAITHMWKKMWGIWLNVTTFWPWLRFSFIFFTFGRIPGSRLFYMNHC